MGSHRKFSVFFFFLLSKHLQSVGTTVVSSVEKERGGQQHRVRRCVARGPGARRSSSVPMLVGSRRPCNLPWRRLPQTCRRKDSGVVIWADPRGCWTSASALLLWLCLGTRPQGASRPSPSHQMAPPAVSRGLVPEGALLFLREQVPCVPEDGRGGAGQPFRWGVTNAPSLPRLGHIPWEVAGTFLPQPASCG